MRTVQFKMGSPGHAQGYASVSCRCLASLVSECRVSGYLWVRVSVSVACCLQSHSQTGLRGCYPYAVFLKIGNQLRGLSPPGGLFVMPLAHIRCRHTKRPGCQTAEGAGRGESGGEILEPPLMITRIPPSRPGCWWWWWWNYERKHPNPLQPRFMLH